MEEEDEEEEEGRAGGWVNAVSVLLLFPSTLRSTVEVDLKFDEAGSFDTISSRKQNESGDVDCMDGSLSL
jgi:hypothetical protein